MQNIIKIKGLIIAIAVLILASCKKNDADPRPEIDVIFTTVIDDYTVSFDNQTKGGVSYKWEFGDGATSTEASPVHTYAGKGKYVPTLYVTTASGNRIEGSTVLRISKSSPVKLDDDSFDDWNDVTKYGFTSSAPSNSVRAAKFDYDGSSIYFYFEMTRTLSDNDVFDFYMDTDDNPATGYDLSGSFPGAGVDVLMEGQILGGADAWADILYHAGPGNGWSWDGQSITEAYALGTAKKEGILTKVEGKFDRTKLKGMTGKAIRFGIILTKNDWSASVGYIPDNGSPAIRIDMTE
ncbi:PKD domain-containing protein [Agriterribacter sp.]|uniref:PKD domain-containing protein n=1 Tax=Agriterribacter sp. TaxID=2821509 RepID=UPI002BAA440C|nr:PKD domain-containing protein [Agriterribacter sp.]HTN05882.1 PKD domain-containing protein [Agriterribacter sp.]